MTQPGTLKCQRCGAPIHKVEPNGLAYCEYCGAMTRVAAPVAAPPRPPPQWPGNSYDPRFVQAQMQAQANVAARVRRSSLVWVALSLGITVVAGAVSFLAQSKAVPPPAALKPQPAAAPATAATASGPSWWSASPPGCLIDGNGDGILDVLGMARSGVGQAPTLIDGHSGQVLWTTKGYPKDTRTFCLSKDWFGVAQANFHLEIFQARQRSKPLELTGRDKLRAFALGDGCAELETADGSRFGVRLPGGAKTHCRTKKLTTIYDEPPGVIGLTGKRAEIESDGRRYVLQKRSSGTPVLTVTASKRAHKIFSKELPYAATTFSSAIAVASYRVVLWGAKLADRKTPLLIGLNSNDGNVLYSIAQKGDPSGSVNLFESNGRYVIATWGGALHAYDPMTGREVWRVGR